MNVIPEGITVKQWEMFMEHRGNLLPVEFKKLPFVPKRVFVVNDVPAGTKRGGHAHKQTQQYLMVLNGEIKVVLRNTKERLSQFILNAGQGVFIDKMIWDEQVFLSDDAALLVLSSTEYNADDYIRDFEEFKKMEQ